MRKLIKNSIRGPQFVIICNTFCEVFILKYNGIQPFEIAFSS